MSGAIAPWMGVAAGSSGVLFVGTLLIIPWIVVRLPANYFSHPQRRQALWRESRHPVAVLTGVILKNGLGAMLFAVGSVMLLVPGQGLLTMLVGLMLMNYPGKYRFECWLATRPPVWRILNRLRDRFGSASLQRPEKAPEKD